MILLALFMAQATSSLPVGRDDFQDLRAIVAPSLSCERSFDVQRRQLNDEARQIYKMPSQTQEDARVYREASATHRERYSKFEGARAAKCQTDVFVERLKAKLMALQPKVGSYQAHMFATGFFDELRKTSENASDFRAGYDFRQYGPPSPPPAPR